MVKFAVLIALLLPAGCLFGQESQVPGNTAPPMLQRPYEAARDFFNVYAFANATYDTNGYYLNNGANSGASAGVSAGGGASGYHQWSTGLLELNYRGDYRSYLSSSAPSGNEQNLSLLFKKEFNKRWTFFTSLSAGILNNGGTPYSSSPSPTNPSAIIQTNPFSYETRYADVDLGFTYQKSVRLSYQVTGSYVLTRYNGYSGYGSNDITGALSANYSLTRKTIVSGTYSHSNFVYQRAGGNSNVDNVFVTLSHRLAPNWTVSGSGGITRVASSGVISFPVNVQVGGQILPVLALGHYSQTAILPYYQATLVHSLRHDSLSVSGGQSVTPGNGYLLASRNLGLNGLWVHTLRRSNLSVAGYYARLSSVANTVLEVQSNRGFDVSYAYNLAYHMGVNARYDLIDYSSFGSYGGRADNRFSFGFYVSSKDVPIGLF